MHPGRLGVLGISICYVTRPSKHTIALVLIVTPIDGKNNEDFLSIMTGLVG
jgi:hypothetical protein